MRELPLDSITNPRNIEKRRGTTMVLRLLLFAGLVLASVGGFFVVSFLLWAQCLDFRGFRSASGSMCPTICQNERFLVGMDAFNSRPPQRGDVILFEFDPADVNYLKRIVGLPGDTVARGPSNTILVNGKPLVLPAPCGRDNAYSRLAQEGRAFDPVKVPDNAMFVIGDNLDDSYDSRFFGVIRLDKVRGKALLIYASSNLSRIGCRVE